MDRVLRRSASRARLIRHWIRFRLTIDGTAGRLEVAGAEFPHLGPVTVRGARGRDRLAELPVPAGYDRYPGLAGTVIHTLAHAYATVRDDLVHGTSVAPDFSHAVHRHRLLDAITRSAATGRRISTTSGD